MLFLFVTVFFYFLGQLPLTSLIASLGSVYLKQRFHLSSHRSSFWSTQEKKTFCIWTRRSARHFFFTVQTGGTFVIFVSHASLHALFICVRFFLFLGTAPTNVIDCFTGFSLSQAAISLVFTPFVFLNNARKEHVLYLNQAERSPFFFHSPDRRNVRHFCFSCELTCSFYLCPFFFISWDSSH